LPDLTDNVARKKDNATNTARVYNIINYFNKKIWLKENQTVVRPPINHI